MGDTPATRRNCICSSVLKALSTWCVKRLTLFAGQC